jgi:endoglucanase
MRFFLPAIVMLFILSSLGRPGNNAVKIQAKEKNTIDAQGAIVRGDLSKRQIALVFTGDQFADGGEIIREVLYKNKVHASFFLTGNFYKTSAFKPIIVQLKADGNYMGPHSDKHLLYADWTKRDSLLVTKKEFIYDLQKNYKRMAKFGIKKADAPYFLPPYEWYNRSIASWTKEIGLQLVNFSPGTRSAADYTYPEMAGYRSSEEIYNSIFQYETKDPNGLNGFILLMHIGTDQRRVDKLYNRLDTLMNELQRKGYTFVRIDQLLN